MENKIFTLRFKGHIDNFEIVKEVPVGYSIWNIGMNMPEGWLPLCRLVNPNSDSQLNTVPGAEHLIG